jgi:hypothetical protein
MRLRPFGAGRKRQRQAARYDAQYVVKSDVIVTSVTERRDQPPLPVRRRTRIVHPESVAYPRYHPPELPPLDQSDLADAVEPVSPMPVAPVDPTSQRGSTGQDVAGPTPATLAKLLRAKVMYSDHLKVAETVPAPHRTTAGSPTRDDLGPTFARRRGRRVTTESTTPAVRRRARARSERF